MDDVWLVIGLLLFGSLLFCLCCYKVTNLLYMLYHIDDATESLTGNEIAVGGAVGDAIIGLALASASATDNQEPINQKHNNKNGNHSPDKDLPSASILSKTIISGCTCFFLKIHTYLPLPRVSKEQIFGDF